jgi:hypothetical protein
MPRIHLVNYADAGVLSVASPCFFFDFLKHATIAPTIRPTPTNTPMTIPAMTFGASTTTTVLDPPPLPPPPLLPVFVAVGDAVTVCGKLLIFFSAILSIGADSGVK